MATLTIEQLVADARARLELPPPSERRRIRQAAGVSCADIGTTIGVTRDAVLKWERGLRLPSPHHARQYGEILRRLAEVTP